MASTSEDLFAAIEAGDVARVRAMLEADAGAGDVARREGRVGVDASALPVRRGARRCGPRTRVAELDLFEAASFGECSIG